MRLLIAEDDSALREAMRLVFEAEGHEVLLATSLAELLARLIECPPDMVLMDAGLHGAGVPLWRALVARPEWADRVLLVTGNVPALGELSGHPAVLGKPFDYGALVARIAAVGPKTVAPDRSAATPDEGGVARSA